MNIRYPIYEGVYRILTVNRSPLFKESITLTDCSINNAMLVFMCLVCLDGYVNAL